MKLPNVLMATMIAGLDHVATARDFKALDDSPFLQTKLINLRIGWEH